MGETAAEEEAGSDSCIWGEGKVPSFQPAGAFEDLGAALFPPLTLWAPRPRGTDPSVEEIKRLATQTCREDQYLFPVVLEMYYKL